MCSVCIKPVNASKHKDLTNIDRVLPVFQHFRDNKYVNICPVFPVPILEGKGNRATTKLPKGEEAGRHMATTSCKLPHYNAAVLYVQLLSFYSLFLAIKNCCDGSESINRDCSQKV